MPVEALLSRRASRPSFCRSSPMLASTCSRVISCCVAWSIRAGQVGLHWGDWQVSIRWKGQPFRAVLLFLVASWRLRSQHCRARDKDVPFTWKSIQLLKQNGVWSTSERDQERRSKAGLIGCSVPETVAKWKYFTHVLVSQLVEYGAVNHMKHHNITSQFNLCTLVQKWNCEVTLWPSQNPHAPFHCLAWLDPARGLLARCVKVWGGILVTPRMQHDGRVFKNSSMSSLCGARVSLPFGDQCVGQAGGGEHSPEKNKNTQHQAFNTIRMQGLESLLYLSNKCLSLHGSYVTSLREFFNSFPRFCM